MKANERPVSVKQKMLIIKQEGLFSADEVKSKGPNTYIFRRSFYYRHDGSATQFAQNISKELTKSSISHKLVDCGEVNRPFRGGASIATQSHWWAVFTVSDDPIAESKLTDPDLIRARNKASTKYPNYDKDTAMLKVLQKGVTDGEKEQKKNKKEHEKFGKDIKDSKVSNDKEHKEFKKDIKNVDKRVDKVEKDMNVNESFQCYTGAKSGKKIQILHGTHSAGVATIICRDDVFVLEIDGRHLGSFYSFEQALEQAEIEDMHFRPEEIAKARAYFDQAGRSEVNESTSVDLATKALIAEIVKLIGEGHTEVSPDVITTKVSAVIGKPFMLKDLVTANNNSPALQHYIDSINPTKIKFSTDILTVKNEDPMKEKEKAQSGVANMATRAAGRNRLGENALPNTLSNLTASATQEKEQAQTQFINLAGAVKLAKEKALAAKEKFEQLSQKVKALKDRLSSPTGQRVQQGQERAVNYTSNRNVQYGLDEGSTPAERRANRELWDKVNSKGRMPEIDRERYTDMSKQGLEGPIRLKSGKIVYYDNQAGKYYDRDSDMYLDNDDYMAHDAGSMMGEANTPDNSFNYRLLGRLQTDCDYFLNHGNRSARTLWAGDVDSQIAKMKELWTALPEDGKPEWLSMEDILTYEEEMKRNDVSVSEAHVGEYSGITFYEKGDRVSKVAMQGRTVGTITSVKKIRNSHGIITVYSMKSDRGTIYKEVYGSQLEIYHSKAATEKDFDADALRKQEILNRPLHRNPSEEFDESQRIQEDGNEGAYSWRTTKNTDGSYNWAVIKIAYQKPVETIKSGNEPTRPRALAKAKKEVMPYRRGSVTENLDDAAAEADYNTGHRRGMADAKAGKPSDSSDCISKRERNGYADGYKQLGEAKRGTPGFAAFKDSQRKAGKDLSAGGIDRSKKKEEKKDKVDEGWESGPEEREPAVDRSDWDYDQAEQEKLDAASDMQPKKTTYLLVGRGPNMEPNYTFGDEFNDIEAAKAARVQLAADPATPNPTMISIQTINRNVNEGVKATTTLDLLRLAGLK